MKTRAALLFGPSQPFKVEEVDLDEPRANEVRVRVVASGICHSDAHVISGDLPMDFPVLVGHEGAGIVEAVGSGVTRVEPGDHVIMSFIPSCGHCRWCASGRSNLCDLGAGLMIGQQLDGTYRMRVGGEDIAQMCLLGTFAEHTVVPDLSVVHIPSDVPLGVACLLGCCVPTGYGAAVHKAQVRPGEVVAVFGAGGVGMNVVQGAAMAGARAVVVVEPVELKRSASHRFGATHVINPTAEDPLDILHELTNGQGADVAVLTPGVLSSELVAQGFSCIGKGGRLVCVALSPVDLEQIDISPFELVLFEKSLLGCVYGSSNPFADIPTLVELYRAGKLNLDGLVTRTYALDEIDSAFSDMLSGTNVRGVIHLDGTSA